MDVCDVYAFFPSAVITIPSPCPLSVPWRTTFSSCPLGGRPPEAGVWFPRLPMGSHLGQLPPHHGGDHGHFRERAVSLEISPISECISGRHSQATKTCAPWWKLMMTSVFVFGSIQCGWSSGWAGTHSSSASTWRWGTCHRWAWRFGFILQVFVWNHQRP